MDSWIPGPNRVHGLAGVGVVRPGVRPTWRGLWGMRGRDYHEAPWVEGQLVVGSLVVPYLCAGCAAGFGWGTQSFSDKMLAYRGCLASWHAFAVGGPCQYVSSQFIWDNEEAWSGTCCVLPCFARFLA